MSKDQRQWEKVRFSTGFNIVTPLDLTLTRLGSVSANISTASTIVLLGQKTTAVVATAATGFHTIVNHNPVRDSATTLTTETTLNQDQVNETNRILANLGNLGTTIFGMHSYIGSLKQE